ncbi:AraC family transcriptional regulator [Streptomyces sp. NL15-2K]|uniref:AraC family transcriptional regulator n=1 Tax=Streptomyces sp. NL15-2K TaxID=376149 RepID=UPI000F588828|nr:MULTISPECIES: AraC family transcriptional regulator [Actinomycetes]WKX07111.1 AraC family transcriptional regulator [Kutzneria buriramensis]GCB53562.1 araC family transcriptional regulator [Streptomyces sp. NL15-2K]
MFITSAVSTSDLDEARQRLGDIYCPHRIAPGPRSDASEFFCRQTGHGWPGLAAFDLQYGGREVVVDPVPFDDFVLVTRPLRGRFGVTAQGSGEGRGAETSSHAIVTDPYGWHQLRWRDDCRVINLVFERWTVEKIAAEVWGQDEPCPVRFELGPPRRGGAAIRWESVSRMLWSELRVGKASPDGASLTDSPLLRDALVRLGVSALLEAYPHSLQRVRDNAGADTAAPTAVRRANAFIELNADRDIGLAEVAEAARLSVRGLQAAYHRHDLGSPMRQLKEARLRRARTELRTANPGTTTVSAVAGRWGFTNVGRFAADYRRMFGTTPGRDLAGE